ncbi:MAG: carbonic anhydrase [Methylosarcina sp.]
MKKFGISRREWLVSAGCLSLSALTGCVTQIPQSDNISLKFFPSNAAEALLRLITGNQRFMQEKSIHTHETASWRSLLVKGQKPFATVLGCSDSRVPPEMVFDVGFGDIFTIRLAGNIIAEDVIGSMQYAVAHLHTPLIIVLGHEGCGAVSATVEEMLGKTEELKHIEALIALIKPGLVQLNMQLGPKALLHAAVEANVRWSMRQLSTLPEAKRALSKKLITLVGAVYELDTGKVRFLD